MGDLYRVAPFCRGAFKNNNNGAGSVLSEWQSARRLGLFADAPRPNPGFNLPSEFSNKFLRLDKMFDLKAVPRGTGSTFLV